ncbi:MAG: hypothetical protein CW336_06230 [Bacteroidetes bacterium]|nr:hypothetical protein [Bacteroidota bacterium]
MAFCGYLRWLWIIFLVNGNPDFGSGDFVCALRFNPNDMTINEIIKAVLLKIFIINRVCHY